MHPCRHVAVEVGGKRKMTAEAKGREETRSEETMDFLIGGDVADRDGEVVKIEVWDVTFVVSEKVSGTAGNPCVDIIRHPFT